MEDDIFYADTFGDPLMCEHSRELPEDTIPGWKILLRIYKQNREEDSKMFSFYATRVDSSPHDTCFNIKRVVSNTLWEIGDRGTIISEVVKLGVKELRVSITKWMMENDESCRILQRVLDYGLNNSI